ncbi:hypothetical protein HELRODRAFT_136970, partial [Helobdella robusta]|uniref:ubiquitinyl hydrolase 1 n=1 Tax=Helobdella robusta TaxID=6412 RepID=T1EIG7_HELRO
GYVGLDNMGNTCFINCVIQALANTPELRNYFLSNRYKKDLNKTNVLGTGGLLANAFADMMVALWKGTNKSYYPNKIK